MRPRLHARSRRSAPRTAITTLGALALGLAARTATPAPGPSLAAPEVRGGYWLGVDLVGPAAAQQGAATELGEGLLVQTPAEVAPPGVLVGHVAEAPQALQWIADHAFEPRPPPLPDPRGLQRVPAPAPAGGLLERHGAIVAAFIVSGATSELRPREIDWPLDQAAVLPAGSPWQPAALVPDHAPLFAAPAPVIPPAAERHAMAHRRGGLYVLGWVDRCTEDAGGLRCLRWAQVVARDGDRFTPGYLPMLQVTASDAWVRGEGVLPRAQLQPVGLALGAAQWVLYGRGRDNVLHRRTLHAPATSRGWPMSHVSVEGDVAIVSLGDEPPLRLALDATLDARPRGGESDDENPDETP